MMNYQELLKSTIIPFDIITLTQKAANNIVPVLIQGEQGTEKELIAKIIHYTGNWKDYPFSKIDCRILAEDPFNAYIPHLFKEIHYGITPATLYFKEVGLLNQNSQLKLLKLVEDGLFQNGDSKKIIQNIRLISSSSENLKEKIAQGKFSEDLYYQLSTLSIFVPPLRDRANEISNIVQYILEEYSKKMKIKKVEISNNVLMLLKSYWWPGNLRELEQVVIRSAILSNGGNLLEKDLLFGAENGKSSFFSFLKKVEADTSITKRKNFSNESPTIPSSTFFIELVHRIKNPLVSIKTFTQLLREKYFDEEFRNQFYSIVTQDIEKIDSLLNDLLNYIKANTPIEKANTVHLVLDDVLAKYEPNLKDKQIKLFKKYERELPETIVHEEHLKYIFGSLIQYVITSMPQKGTIGLLTKTLNNHIEKNTDKKEKYIEIVIAYTGYKRPDRQLQDTLGIPVHQQEEMIELELKLINEIIQKNRGVMKFEVNEKKPRTLILLKFPVERRRIIGYPATNT